MSDSSQPHGLQPTRLLHPWDFPDKSTGMGVSLTDLPIHHVVKQVSILVTDNDGHLGVVHTSLRQGASHVTCQAREYHEQQGVSGAEQGH